MTQDNWISIKELLPNEEGEYLTVDMTSGYFPERIRFDGFYFRDWYPILGKGYKINHKITHWQPLPPPPNKS